MYPDNLPSQPIEVLYQQLDETCRELFARHHSLVRTYHQAVAMDGRRAAIVRQLRLDADNTAGATVIQRVQPLMGRGHVDDFTIIKFRERELGVTQLLIEHRRARTYLRRLQDDSEARMQHTLPPILQQSEANQPSLLSAISRLRRTSAITVRSTPGTVPINMPGQSLSHRRDQTPLGRNVKVIKVASAHPPITPLPHPPAAIRRTGLKKGRHSQATATQRPTRESAPVAASRRTGASVIRFD